MSLTTTVQDWLRTMGPRASSALIARRHIAAETSTDVDEICATVSDDVFFALPVRTRAGQELREGSVLTDAGQVRGYYASRSGSYVVRNSAQVRSIATDWYLFNETAATLLGTGAVNGVDATGREWVVRSTVLFPTAPDGIRGEICATRDPMEDILRGTAPPVDGDGAPSSAAAAEVAHAAVLDRFSLAVRSRDWEAAASEMATTHTLAVRLDAAGGSRVHTARSREESLAELPSIFGGADELTLLVRIATEWYVFAEYLLRLRAGGARHLAVIQPIEHGRLTGFFGFGRDEV